MSDEARILIAQHAKTAALFGVDFLPLGNASAIVVPEESAPEPVSEAASEPIFQSAPASGQSERSFQSAADLDIDPIGSAELRQVYEALGGKQAQLDALKAKYELDAPHQHFNTQFQNIVFGEGDSDAQLMFIGEAPGEDEDACGRPFVGRAGQLLENMIKAMGLSRETVYIANVLKTRPANNATPTGQEAGLCAPYLMEQVRIVSPKVIVTLGLPASHLLLGISSPMRSMRGNWHGLPARWIEDGIPGVEVMPTYHPAYLLRSYTEDNRRKVWSDLTQVIKKLGLSS